jgi:hypothetical protein
MKTTFQETRTHLGVETQRHRSDLAVARTTPALLGLFSLVTLWAAEAKDILHARPADWYAKEDPTFSDAIATVRRILWAVPNSSTSRTKPVKCRNSGRSLAKTHRSGLLRDVKSAKSSLERATFPSASLSSSGSPSSRTASR